MDVPPTNAFLINSFYYYRQISDKDWYAAQSGHKQAEDGTASPLETPPTTPQRPRIPQPRSRQVALRTLSREVYFARNEHQFAQSTELSVRDGFNSADLNYPDKTNNKGNFISDFSNWIEIR